MNPKTHTSGTGSRVVPGTAEARKNSGSQVPLRPEGAQGTGNHWFVPVNAGTTLGTTDGNHSREPLTPRALDRKHLGDLERVLPWVADGPYYATEALTESGKRVRVFVPRPKGERS